MTAVNHKGTVVLLLDKPSVDELRHETSSHFASLMVSLQLLDLLLELLEQVILGEMVLLLGRFCLLVGLDLSLGTSPLALRLQHVCALALGN